MEILVTPRLTLRPPIALDADDIAHWLSDWDVAKMLAFVPYPYHLEDAEKWIAKTSDPESQIYTIHRQSLIGVAGVFGEGDTRSLGYWLGKPFHRQGFMREALTCLFDQTFVDPSIAVITSGAAADNIASLKLQESMGFKAIGTKEIEFVSRKTDVSMITTALTRDAWLSRSKTGFIAAKALPQMQSSQFAA